jgi:uncharacterized membrane protein YdjX (TVP38/TMEM64 family)
MEPQPKPRRPWWKRVVVVTFVVVIGVWLWTIWDHRAVMEWTRNLQPLPYFIFMALAPAIGLPVTPFFVLAGVSFGKGPGVIGSLIALGVNLALCYQIARRMRPMFSSLLKRFGWELPDLSGRERKSARFALAVKLAPGIPQFAKNYALGVAGVPFWVYFVLSMLISGLYGVLLVVLGGSLFEHDRRQLIWVAVGALALGLLLWLLRRRSARDAEPIEA